MSIWNSLKKAAGTKTPEASPPGPAGRNDPCPCGSGKKYKKCCLEKHQAEESKRLKELQFKPKEGTPAAKATTAPKHPQDRSWFGMKRFFSKPSGPPTTVRRTPGEK